MLALRKFLILRKPRSGCLEERTALIQPIINSFTRSFAGVTGESKLSAVPRRLISYHSHSGLPREQSVVVVLIGSLSAVAGTR